MKGKAEMYVFGTGRVSDDRSDSCRLWRRMSRPPDREAPFWQHGVVILLWPADVRLVSVRQPAYISTQVLRPNPPISLMKPAEAYRRNVYRTSCSKAIETLSKV